MSSFDSQKDPTSRPNLLSLPSGFEMNEEERMISRWGKLDRPKKLLTVTIAPSPVHHHHQNHSNSEEMWCLLSSEKNKNNPICAERVVLNLPNGFSITFQEAFNSLHEKTGTLKEVRWKQHSNDQHFHSVNCPIVLKNTLLSSQFISSHTRVLHFVYS
jgi:hypothetical protein